VANEILKIRAHVERRTEELASENSTENKGGVELSAAFSTKTEYFDF